MRGTTSFAPATWADPTRADPRVLLVDDDATIHRTVAKALPAMLVCPALGVKRALGMMPAGRFAAEIPQEMPPDLPDYTPGDLPIPIVATSVLRAPAIH